MYFCKNCGEPMWEDTAMKCERCGSPRNKGNSYCHNCGNVIDPASDVCMICGVNTADYYIPIATKNSSVMSGFGTTFYPGTIQIGVGKSKIVAGILGLFVGYLGVHNFYLGNVKKGVTQLTLYLAANILSCVGIGLLLLPISYVWGIIDAIMIFTGKTDIDGKN